MNTAQAVAEAITRVRAYTKTVKGKEVNVRQHVRNYDAADEMGKTVEVTDEALDVISNHVIDENFTLQDIIDGYTTGRSDYKVANIEVDAEYDEDGEEYEDGGEIGSVLMLTGQIIDTKTGIAVADWSRTLDFDASAAKHDSFFVDERHQGKGIATDFNARAFDMYRKVGLGVVTTYANGNRKTGVGRYAWAMQGFDFRDASKKDMMKSTFAEYLNDLKLPEAAAQVAKMNHSWEIASFVVDGKKVGKKFMIDIAPDWNGVMKLKDTEPSWKMFKTYKENAKGKGTK